MQKFCAICTQKLVYVCVWNHAVSSEHSKVFRSCWICIVLMKERFEILMCNYVSYFSLTESIWCRQRPKLRGKGTSKILIGHMDAIVLLVKHWSIRLHSVFGTCCQWNLVKLAQGKISLVFYLKPVNALWGYTESQTMKIPGLYF